MKIKINKLKYIICFFLTILIDRYSKFLALESKNALFFNDIFFMNFVPTINHGFSFGIFNLEYEILRKISFFLVAILLMTIIFSAVVRARSGKNIFYEIIIFGSSISNLFDRALYGGVVDFICISSDIFPWVIILNFADIFISSFAILLFIDWIKNSDEYIFENFYL